MAGESSTEKVTSDSETHLANLKDGGQRGYIVVRIVRLWDCIIPPSNTFTGIDFLAVDSQGFAMHGTIPSDLADDFRPLFKEGNIYTVRIFEVGPRLKKTHIAVPLETLIFFNVSTIVHQVTDYIHKIPDFYFKFASHDEVMQRNEKTYYMTDLIGIFQGATDVKSITLSNNRGSVDKRDIFLVLLSGEKLRITLWDPKLMDLNITDVIRLGFKPVLALAGIFIKDNQGNNKQLNSCSGTKFYLNPQIPQATELRAKFPVDGRPIDLLSSSDPDLNQEYTYPDAVEKTIQDLLYMNPAIIKGLKFKVTGKVLQFQTKQGWFYTSCRDCTYGVKPTPSGYRCDNGHGITPTKMSLRISFVLADGIFKLQLIVFGNLAQRLTGIELANLTVGEKMDTKNVPQIANQILQKEFEFVVGISDQTYSSGLNFKIFRFTQLTDKLETISGNKRNATPSSDSRDAQQIQTEIICTPPSQMSPSGTQASPLSTPADELQASAVKVTPQISPSGNETSNVTTPTDQVEAPAVRVTKSTGKKMKTCARKVNFE